MIQEISQFVEHNPIFTGGLGLGITGGILAYARNVPKQIATLIKRKTTISLEILEGDSVLFSWVRAWLAQHPYSHKTRLLSAWVRYIQENAQDKTTKEIAVGPAPGIHFLKYKNHYIWLEHDRRELASPGDNSKGEQNKYVFTMLGRNSKIFREMLEEIQQNFDKDNSGKVQIYTSISGAGFDLTASREKRPMDSIVLREGLSDMIVKDLSKFLGDADWYYQTGIPYRRGYLLYGPPGTGKTSLVFGIAGYFDMPVYCLSLNGMSDNRLLDILTEVPPHCILLLEDIDCSSSVSRDNNSGPFLTFSGLLNALDGIQSPEGIIVFMTTNHPEKLDPALKRPGRVDLHIKLDYVDVYQAQRFFERFFPDHPGAVEFGISYGDKGLSPAQIQEILLEFRDNPDSLFLNSLHTNNNQVGFMA